MLKRLRTMLKGKRTRRRRTQSPAPTLEDIRKVLKEAADIQERSAKRHAELERSLDKTGKMIAGLTDKIDKITDKQADSENKQAKWENRQVEWENRQAEWENRQVEWENRQVEWENKQTEWQNRHAEIDDSLARIGQTVGGVTNNLGKITEEFFRQAMENEKLIVIDKATFDTVLADQTYKANGKAMQCDLVLVNKKYIAIIEIKHYLHPDDIGRFDEKLRAVLPEVLPAAYKHLQLIPAMACKGLSLRAKEEVQKYGFALLRPRGQRSKVESEHLRIRPPVADKEK